MPVLYEYKDGNGHYILTRIRNNVVTYQITSEGIEKLNQFNVTKGKPFQRSILFELYQSGDVYTLGTGFKSDLYTHPGQGELDFSEDAQSESLFPGCSGCESQDDLHLTEIVGEEYTLSILCHKCRPKRSDIDISIPLPFISRKLLKRILDMKKAHKIDASVLVFQELLDLEFTDRWNMIANRKRQKAIQGQLTDPTDSGRLI